MNGLVIFLPPPSESYRLGFIIDFLSKATLIGFMAGAAIIVSLQQLKCLLGIVNFTKQMGLVPVLSSVFHRKDEVLLLKFHSMHFLFPFSILSSLHVFKLYFFVFFMLKFLCPLLQWSWQTILMGVSFLVFLLVARHVVSYFLYYSFFPLLSTLPSIREKDIMYVPCFCSTTLYLFAKKNKEKITYPLSQWR